MEQEMAVTRSRMTTDIFMHTLLTMTVRFNGTLQAVTICLQKKAPSKARAAKYDEKLAVQNITFDELVQLSANYTPPKKEAAKKPAKKKK